MIQDNFLPEGFQAMIRADFGPSDAETLLTALADEPETSVRLNLRKPHPEPVFTDMMPTAWCRSGFYLNERPRFTSDPLLHAGVYYVQDASSMVYETILNALDFKVPVKAADLCAAPGGKTTAMLNALPDGSVMLANEYNSSRASILKENLIKFGYPDVIITNSDTSRLATMRGMFDIVAVDSPCSGEGMMRKEETARTQWSEGLIRQCSALQREILESAVQMLAPGGYLIYSTCTFNTAEDEDNASWIANSCPLKPIDSGLAGIGGIKNEIKGSIPCLRFIPGFTRGEGLFLSIFRKCDDADGGYHKPSKKKARGMEKPKIDSGILHKAQSWIRGEFEIIDHSGHLLALSPATAEVLSAIPKGVRILSAGIEIGEVKGKDLIPSHQLAMSTVMSHPFPEIELNLKEAQRYLSREAIPLPTDTPKGHITVTYKNHPLGFMKNNGNRANNLYPQEYKIRILK